MHYKKFLTRQNYIAFTILCVSITIGIFFIQDPFHLFFPNKSLNLTKEQIHSVSSQVAKDCSTQRDRQDCYKIKLSLVTKKYGMATGEAILYSLQDYDDTSKGCHIIAHYMSNEAYNRSPWEFYRLLDTANVNACGSGFLHGILEAYTQDHSEIEINGTFADKLCSRSAERYRQNMCIHFLGHIFLLNAYGNLEEALPFCEQVRKEWQYDCYDGIFMEDDQKLILSEHGIMELPVLNDDYVTKLEKRCLSYSGDKGKACWVEMAETYAHTYGYHPDIVYARCRKAQTDEYRRGCYLKGVIAMAVYPTFGKPSSLAQLCSYYKNNNKDYGSCVYSLTSALMYYSPKFISRGESFCATVPSSFKGACYGQLTTLLKDLVKDPNERMLLCKVVSEEYRKSCVE